MVLWPGSRFLKTSILLVVLRLGSRFADFDFVLYSGSRFVLQSLVLLVVLWPGSRFLKTTSISLVVLRLGSSFADFGFIQNWNLESWACVGCGQRGALYYVVLVDSMSGFLFIKTYGVL